MKTLLRGKFIVFSVFIKKLESFHTDELKVYLKALEKKKEAKTSRSSRQKEAIKIGAEMNQ